MTPNGFTPTQRAILDVLSDGRPHTCGDLHSCLDDDLAGPAAVRMHICRLRKRLRARRQDIVSVVEREQLCYQHVKLLPLLDLSQDSTK